MQLITLYWGSAPPHTPPINDNYKKNVNVTNDSLPPLRNLQWMSATYSVKM